MDVESVKVSVPHNKLKQSSLFAGLMTYCQDCYVPFPSQYMSVVDIYIGYLNDKLVNIGDDHSLKTCFELANFIDHEQFLTFCVSSLIATKTQDQIVKVINTAHPDVQLNIQLHSPLFLLPEVHLHPKSPVFKSWVEINTTLIDIHDDINNDSIHDGHENINNNINNNISNEQIDHDSNSNSTGNSVSSDNCSVNNIGEHKHSGTGQSGQEQVSGSKEFVVGVYIYKYVVCREFVTVNNRDHEVWTLKSLRKHNGGEVGEYSKFYLHGLTISWYVKTGYYHITGEYLGGSKHGYWTKYYPNSVIVTGQGQFNNGKRCGRWIRWLRVPISNVLPYIDITINDNGFDGHHCAVKLSDGKEIIYNKITFSCPSNCNNNDVSCHDNSNNSNSNNQNVGDSICCVNNRGSRCNGICQQEVQVVDVNGNCVVFDSSTLNIDYISALSIIEHDLNSCL